MATRQFPSITIIQNKLLDDKFTITNAQVKDAEREYKDICKVTGRVPEVQSIEEMVESLERGQMKSAKAHAGRVQEAIIFYQKNLKSQSFGDSHNNNNLRNTFDDHIQEKNYVDVRSSASRKTTPLLPPDPAPDYRTDDKYTPLSRTVSRGRPQSGQNVQRQSDGGMDRQTMERLEKLSASKEASMRLRQGNPDLTDLSDKNRPTKLAEKYSQTYDDEWSYALEELQKLFQQSGDRAEEKAISCLLEILMNTFQRNLRKANEQLEDIETEVSAIMLRVTLVKGATTPRGPGSVQADTSALKQYRKSLASLSIPELQKGFQDVYLPSILRQYGINDPKQLPSVIAYARRCVELTWLMNVQDPPLALDMLTERQYIDTDRYRAFTKSGRALAFYVWPALLLHKDGALLVKGVAQGQ